MNKYLKDEFERNVPETDKSALRLCAKAADEMGLSIFLIGGVVRDLISGKLSLDIDITVKGNAIEFAHYLQEKYQGVFKVKETHDSFKTAKIYFKKGRESTMLDIASTRKEIYPSPASLPVIVSTGCELYEDVIRRDFSINSMALSLNHNTFCLLIDNLGGYNDLQKGIIRVLHPTSFIDDPTRIIRALKFSVRFGYKLEDETERLMREVLDSGRFDNLAGERVKLELKQAFNADKAECADRFISEGIYRLVDIDVPQMQIGADVQDAVSRYRRFIDNADNIWLIYLGALLADLPAGKLEQIAGKLYMSGSEEVILLKTAMLCASADVLSKAQSRFDMYEFFEKAEIETIIAFAARHPELEDKVELYLNELKDTKIIVNGDTLIGLGLKPGPVFGEILRKVLKARINKEISASEEERYAGNLVK